MDQPTAAEEKRRIAIGQIFIFNEKRPPWLQLYKISEDWWLNTEDIMLHEIEECMNKKLDQINENLEQLKDLTPYGLQGYEETALAEYKRTLNMEKAIARAEMHKADEGLANSPL